MAVSERDKQRLSAQARDLKAVECDELLDAASARRTIDAANAHRRAEGRPELDEDASPPELGFYERARALGLRRIRR